MPELQTRFMQSDASRAYSASVWQSCALDAIRDGSQSGIIVEDDFDSFTPTASRYNIVGASATCVPILTEPGGVVNLACTNSQNGEAYLVGGLALGAWGSIISNSIDMLWYETRVKVSDITNGGYFFGLARASDVAAGFMANSTEAMVTTAKYIGFKTAQATPSKLDVIYANAAAQSTYATAAATLVASTYVKLGIRFDGSYNGAKNYIHFYVNGVEVGQDTTNTLGLSAGASNVPISTPMHVVWGAKTNASAALTVGLDRYRGVMKIDDATFG